MAERNTTAMDATGASRPPDWTPDAAAAERLDELRQYISDRQAKREVIARTRTKLGQELDWVPIESQSPNGIVAEPPDEDVEVGTSTHPDWPTNRAVTELELPDAEKGPPGTVPIVRRNVDLITSTRGVQKWLSKSGQDGPLAIAETTHSSFADGLHIYAFAQYIGLAYGTEGVINLWQPATEWSDEFSLGQLWLSSGVDYQHQTVEAGVHCFKDYTGDWFPHIFVFYTTNNYRTNGDNIGGYNQDVDGWQQRSDTLYPGAGFTRVSTDGPASQFEVDFKVQYLLGNWWIRANGQWMGYYPSSLFASTGMRDRAEVVQWGGEVFDAAGHPGTSGTDMGSGRFPWEGFGRAAYMRNLMLQIDPAGTLAPFVGPTIADRTDCYDIKFNPAAAGAWGYNFFWGGTGRNGACP